MSKDLNGERELGVYISERRVLGTARAKALRCSFSSTFEDSLFCWSEQGEEVVGDAAGEVRTLPAIGGGKMGFPSGLTTQSAKSAIKYKKRTLINKQLREKK